MEFMLNHDMHIHTRLSECCHDDMMTPEIISQFADDNNYDVCCLTDHLWSEHVPDASDWYKPQTIMHVEQSKPLITSQRMLFGCETEYLGGGRLGMTLDDFNRFQFVVIPLNHMHMKGFVRPLKQDGYTHIDMARLMESRLRDLSMLPLPFHKIGIAHLTCRLMYAEGDVADVVDAMDRDALLPSFARLAKAGAGIELNALAFDRFDERPDAVLRLYQLAKSAGCKFYAASDAHHVDQLKAIKQNLPRIIKALGLTNEDRFIIKP